MNARNKLNVAYFNGSMIVASVVAMMAQSWPVFVLALVVLVMGNVCTGSIRPRRR